MWDTKWKTTNEPAKQMLIHTNNMVVSRGKGAGSKGQSNLAEFTGCL